MFNSARCSNSLRVRVGSGVTWVDADARGVIRAPNRKASPPFTDVALGNIDPAGAQTLHLPALERNSRLVALLDEVLVPGFFVAGDGGAARGRLGFLDHGGGL